MKLSKDSLSSRRLAVPQPGRHSALLLMDLQNDFFPGGALGIPEAEAIIPTINAYIRHFSRNGWPILATRDWHPPNHCSFRDQEGSQPNHCVQGSRGAQFHSELVLPPGMMVISKGTQPKKDSSSCFEESSLEERLEDLGTTTLFILGLGTPECLKKTVANACRLKLKTVILTDAIKMGLQTHAHSTEYFDDIVKMGGVLCLAEDLSIPVI
ncbi:MAG: isochorismatase family protein [Nitrospirales bacterium]